jgi:integrase/recombinase XerD
MASSTGPRVALPLPPLTPENEGLVSDFRTYKKINRSRAERTLYAYDLALRRLAQFIAPRGFAEAASDDLIAFTGPHLHKVFGVGPDSRMVHVSAVREFYAWALRTKRIQANPAAELEYPQRVRKLPRVMTLKAAEQLLWAPDFDTFLGVRDAAILALLIGCGLRVSGLCALNESNLLADQVDGKPRLFVKAIEKGGRERLVPIPQEAELLLRLYLQHPELQKIDRNLQKGDRVLFVSLADRTRPAHDYRGERRRMSRWAVSALVSKYGEQVGVDPKLLHPHAARHLYGTELAESNVDILVRQQAMGHADPKSTEIYTHTAMRKLTRDLDAANPLSKIRTPATDLLKRLAG